MTKKKPTLADAGKDIEEGIHQYWDWRHGVDKKLLEHGDRFDEQERRIKQAADYVKEIKGLVNDAIENNVPVETLDEYNDKEEYVDEALEKPLSRLGAAFYGALGGFLTFGFLILLAWWWLR